MYMPPHFQETDRSEVQDLLASFPLAALVATTDAGLVANHIPMVMAEDGDLIGHIALANDLHRAVPDGAEVLVIFKGEEAYVSPNWYPSKAVHHRHVPTWNYQVVHLSGRIAFQHDAKTKRAVVGQLTKLHEERTNGAEAWRMAQAPKDYMESMLANIVAFRITVTRTLAKSKLSQNREPADFDTVTAKLGDAGKPGLARRMKRIKVER